MIKWHKKETQFKDVLETDEQGKYHPIQNHLSQVLLLNHFILGEYESPNQTE